MTQLEINVKLLAGHLTVVGKFAHFLAQMPRKSITKTPSYCLLYQKGQNYSVTNICRIS